MQDIRPKAMPRRNIPAAAEFVFCCAEFYSALASAALASIPAMSAFRKPKNLIAYINFFGNRQGRRD